MRITEIVDTFRELNCLRKVICLTTKAAYKVRHKHWISISLRSRLAAIDANVIEVWVIFNWFANFHSTIRILIPTAIKDCQNICTLFISTTVFQIILCFIVFRSIQDQRDETCIGSTMTCVVKKDEIFLPLLVSQIASLVYQSFGLVIVCFTRNNSIFIWYLKSIAHFIEFVYVCHSLWQVP